MYRKGVIVGEILRGIRPRTLATHSNDEAVLFSSQSLCAARGLGFCHLLRSGQYKRCIGDIRLAVDAPQDVSAGATVAEFCGHWLPVVGQFLVRLSSLFISVRVANIGLAGWRSF